MSTYNKLKTVIKYSNQNKVSITLDHLLGLLFYPVVVASTFAVSMLQIHLIAPAMLHLHHSWTDQDKLLD
jgi:hypothetical protein